MLIRKTVFFFQSSTN